MGRMLLSMAFDVDASQREPEGSRARAVDNQPPSFAAKKDTEHVDMPDLRDKDFDMGGQAMEEPPEVKAEAPAAGSSWLAGVPAIMLMLAPLLII